MWAGVAVPGHVHAYQRARAFVFVHQRSTPACARSCARSGCAFFHGHTPAQVRAARRACTPLPAAPRVPFKARRGAAAHAREGAGRPPSFGPAPPVSSPLLSSPPPPAPSRREARRAWMTSRYGRPAPPRVEAPSRPAPQLRRTPPPLPLPSYRSVSSPPPLPAPSHPPPRSVLGPVRCGPPVQVSCSPHGRSRRAPAAA